MITHRYGEYEPPEEPPFSLDDLVRAATDVMMKYHVSFNEALRALLEQGLPLNQFLKNDDIDSFLDDAIEQVETQQREMESASSPQKGLNRRIDELTKQVRIAKRAAGDDATLPPRIDEAARNRSVSLFYRLRQEARAEPDRFADAVALDEALAKLADLVERIADDERFVDHYGDRFTGDRAPDARTARQQARRYESLETLREELTDARDRGNLFGVDEDRLRDILGDDAYDAFAKARQETLETLAEAMKQEGLAERQEDDGVFKITPAAARKVGERTLSALFSAMKIDGTGPHTVGVPGEGPIEMVRTRPYQYGDPVSSLDLPASMINALVRGAGDATGEGMGGLRLKLSDLEVHETAGVARSAVVVMLDMSGSMSRFGRFHNAKKMALAFDALIRTRYPEDHLSFIGFATFAKKIPVGDILSLGPEPITMMGGGVNMVVDYNRTKEPNRHMTHVPRYFTNMQKGLALAREVLTAQHGKNRQIIMISDGAPTAFYKGSKLHLTYPPTPEAYETTLREVRALTDEGITLNTFLLGNDFDTGYFGEDRFIRNLLAINQGRLFHPQPDSLTQYVLVDYVLGKKRLLEL